MRYHSENFNGIYDFRCRIHNGWIMEQHIHEYSEILYCKKGSCEIMINQKSITLYEKQFVWIPPNYIHQYKATDAQVICAVFSHDFIPFFFQATKGKRMTVKQLDAEKLAAILDTFYLLDHNRIMLITAYLNLICEKVVKNCAFEDASPSDGILYQKVISYIADNFKEDISLKQIAKEFNYNEKYLSHCLHTLTNMHFSQLIAMYRIEYAKKLLIEAPQISVSEIATNSGFSAINTFNRQFKKMTNVTPLEYRDEYFKCFV